MQDLWCQSSVRMKWGRKAIESPRLDVFGTKTRPLHCFVFCGVSSSKPFY